MTEFTYLNTRRNQQAEGVRQHKMSLQDNRPSTPSGKLTDRRTTQLVSKANNTGLPDNLKQGIESLSGMSMDNVRVHYNSSKPAQLNAHAYAQGADIHLAPGQEKHLPHEVWHVVQQAQGRVRPTMQMKGSVPVNDDKSLEQEASEMGAKAESRGAGQTKNSVAINRNNPVVRRPHTLVDATSTCQRQKANGWYRINSESAMRSNDVAHSVQRNLPADTVVKVIDKVAPVSKFTTEQGIKEHSWTKIPLQEQTGWIEDEKLDNAVKDGNTPHKEFLSRIGAERADYHFGVNNTDPQHPLGPRMDYVNEIEAGTVAEHDFHSKHPLPAHITEADHTRLAGGRGLGSSQTPSKHSEDPTRKSAKDYIEAEVVKPDIPEFRTRYEKYTWNRKVLNEPKDEDKRHGDIKTNVDEKLREVHPGVDFSKAALIDQLVQKKHIHFHVTGIRSIWMGDQAPDLTGKDFKDVLNKQGDYQLGGVPNRKTMKDDVTLRELRFIWRYWTRPFLMPDDQNVEQAYTFKGKVTFYYAGKKVKPPWDWALAHTGASPESQIQGPPAIE
jgi:hypothetical protein